MRWLCTLLIFGFVWHFPFFLQAQLTPPQIDSIFRQNATAFRNEGQFDKALDSYAGMLKASKSIGYQKGVVNAYMELGNVYVNRSDYKTSIRYLDSAFLEAEVLNDATLNARIYADLGRNYSNLNLFGRAHTYYEKALLAAAGINLENYRKGNYQYIYNLQAMDLESQQLTDSSFKLLTKAFQALPSPMIASKIARYYLIFHQKNVDSARRYLDLGHQMWATGFFPIHQRSILLRNEGLYYFTIRDYTQAVDFYEQSIQISQDIKNVTDQKVTFRLLYEAHKAMGDEKGKALALERYTALNDSVYQEKDKATEARIDHWLKENDTRHARNYGWLYASIAIVVVLAVLIFYLVRKKSRHQLAKKSEELEQTTSEKQVLIKKVNESYQELINLAKDNDPAFYFRFQEVYPDFEPRLLALVPGMRTSELTLCAYIALGFNSKDIADYTFKAVKTVKNRKYNIRKKFDVPTEQDLGVWFRNLLDI